MGINQSKQLYLEYQQRIDLAQAHRQLGNDYKTSFTSIVGAFSPVGNYKEIKIVQIILKGKEGSPFYMFVTKPKWNTTEEELRDMCTGEQAVSVNIYIETKFIIFMNRIKQPRDVYI